MQNYKDGFSQANRELLSHFLTNLMRNTLSHALLFQALDTTKSNQFLLYLSAMLLCRAPHNKPCQNCQSCQLVFLYGHPDLTVIKPEKKTSAIKIESIRDLTELVYLSPQLGCHRVVMIRCAEKMNVAASNALLKLLEEPPDNVYFLLQAAQLSTMLPTVLSRCQIWRVGDERATYFELTDLIGASRPDDPDLAKVIDSLPALFADLELVVKENKQQCVVAAKWVNYDLYALATILYWINAALIKSLLGQPNSIPQLTVLLPHLTLPLLFKQIDKLNHITRQLNQSIAINALLIIENFLLGYKVK